MLQVSTTLGLDAEKSLEGYRGGFYRGFAILACFVVANRGEVVVISWWIVVCCVVFFAVEKRATFFNF
jgi:hypothetical protein